MRPLLTITGPISWFAGCALTIGGTSDLPARAIVEDLRFLAPDRLALLAKAEAQGRELTVTVSLAPKRRRR